MTTIEARGLTKAFDGRTAVDGVSLDIEAGEVFGFLGPNGAGKTTTVRLLTCLIAPTAGEASIGGFRLGQDDTEIRKMVGILTESPGLYERLSAWKNMDFYAHLYAVPEERRRAQIETYLRMLGLWDRRHDAVGGFSKGMKQKLAIARALIHEPKVLFLDEPTAALDPESAKTVRDFIAELRSEGRTIFLCTHNLEEADRLCDRVAVIKQHIVGQGSPQELRRSLFGRKTVVHVASLSPEILQAVSALPFVQKVEPLDQKLIVSLADPEKQNPVLVRAIVDAGGGIQFVNELRASLEDVYLHLMHDEEKQ